VAVAYKLRDAANHPACGDDATTEIVPVVPPPFK
jgi:hypothetical protein